MASTRECTDAQNMFSNDIKCVRFRCQTLKFSHPNVKFPRCFFGSRYISEGIFANLAHIFDCDDSERLLRELHIRVGKLQSLTPETQTFDVM